MIRGYLLWKASNLIIHAGRRADAFGTMVNILVDLARTLHIQTEARVRFRGIGSLFK